MTLRPDDARPRRAVPALFPLLLSTALLPACGRFDNTRDDRPVDPQTGLPLTDDGRIERLERRMADLEAWRRKVDTTLRELGTNGDAQADATGVMISLRARMEAVESRLSALPPGGGAPDSTAVAALRGELARLSTDLDAARVGLSALAEGDTRLRSRLDALDSWRESTAALLARIEALDIPGAIAGIDAWRKAVDASLADTATWRSEHAARVAALETLSNATAACVARLDLAAPEAPPPSEAERVCAEVRARLVSLSSLPGITATLQTALADLGTRVTELERITSARLARLRELEIALFLEKYRSQKVVAPCGDDAGLAVTLTVSRAVTQATVLRQGGSEVTGRLSDGTYSFAAGGEACTFRVDTAARKLLGWERDALKLPAARNTIPVKELCASGAAQGGDAAVTSCDSVFERREVRP